MRPSGRGWAYAGIALGGLVSVAANVAHSFVPPPGAVTGWRPHPGAVVGAIFWPIFLFVALEILARTRWPTGLRWWQAAGWLTLRFGGLLPVALVAGLVSYRHLAGLLTFYGEDPLTARLGPLAVDGLMVVATGALIATSRTAERVSAVDVGAVVPAGGQSPNGKMANGSSLSTAEISPPLADTARVPGVPPLPAGLVTAARTAAAEHRQRTGADITGADLRTALRVSAGTATDLLRHLTGGQR